jgi:hypothetical protein
MHMYNIRCKQNTTSLQSLIREIKYTYGVLKRRDEPDQKRSVAVLHDVPAFVRQTHGGG